MYNHPQTLKRLGGAYNTPRLSPKCFGALTMISPNAANQAVLTPLQIIFQFQQKHKLSVTKCAFLLGISENQYRKYFINSKNKRNPSQAVLNLCISLDLILSEGLKLPDFPDFE